MSKLSLPITLKMSLKQHVLADDIQDDDELKDIFQKLTELNHKVEKIKNKAKRQKDSK